MSAQIQQTASGEQGAKPANKRKAGRPKGALNKPDRTNELNYAANKTINNALGGIAKLSLATFSSKVSDVANIQIPRIRIQALGMSGAAMELLSDFVTGVQEAPASIRRLAALDILNIAGITTTSQAIDKQTATNKPVSELSADELRALLGQQRQALDKLDRGLGRVVNAAEG
jgi:hypothetical protein